MAQRRQQGIILWLCLSGLATGMSDVPRSHAKTLSDTRTLSDTGTLSHTVTLPDAKLAIRKKQFDHAAQILEALADNTHADSETQYLLATLYRNGSGVEQSHEMAFRWFSRAAHAGHLKAQYALATMYENGWGTETNHELAASWYTKSAAGGHPQSIQRLATLQKQSQVPETSVSSELAFAALRTDDVQVIRQFMRSMSSRDVRNRAGRTLLAEAIIQGASRSFSVIVEKRPVLEKINREGDSAVSLALRLGRIDFLRRIIRLDPDLSKRDSAGNSPVSLAVRQSSAESLTELLSAGAPHDLPDGEGFTALDIAVMTDKDQITALLLAAGATHSQQYLAMQKNAGNSLSISQQIKQLMTVREENASFTDWPLIHIAAYQGRSELVKQILADGASPLEKNPDRETAIQLAVLAGSYESLRIMINSLPSDTLDTKFLEELIRLTIKETQESSAIFLLSRLSKIQRAEAQLHELLLDACHAGLEHFMADLMKDVEVNLASYSSSLLGDAFACAIEAEMPVALKMLQKWPELAFFASQNEQKPLILASARGFKMLVKELLAAGVNVNSSTDDGVTALMASSAAGKSEVVDLLLSNRAEVDQVDTNGLSALHHAVAANMLLAAELLLKHNANIELRDTFSKTPLMYAAKSGDLRFIKLLLSHGARVNRRDSKGHTASKIAELNNNHEISTYLNPLL